MSNSQTRNFIKLPSKRSISPVTKMMTKAQPQTTVISHESNSDSITKSTCIKILALHYHENWRPYCEKLQNKTERQTSQIVQKHHLIAITRANKPSGGSRIICKGGQKVQSIRPLMELHFKKLCQ